MGISEEGQDTPDRTRDPRSTDDLNSRLEAVYQRNVKRSKGRVAAQGEAKQLAQDLRHEFVANCGSDVKPKAVFELNRWTVLFASEIEDILQREEGKSREIAIKKRLKDLDRYAVAFYHLSDNGRSAIKLLVEQFAERKINKGKMPKSRSLRNQRRTNPGRSKNGTAASPTSDTRIPAYRAGKRTIAGHYEQDTYEAVHRLRLQISANEGGEVTLQQLVGRGLAAVFAEQGKAPPPELQEALRPTDAGQPRKPRASTHTSLR